MFVDKSDLERIDPRISEVLERYSLTYFPSWPVSELPPQRCSDDKYITDQYVLDCYRNLHYELIRYRDYHNRVIEGMVDYSFWLVTSMSTQGVQSPLNMYDWQNIHPGKKRYIVANYVQLDTVPVLVQHRPDDIQREGGTPITTLNALLDIYGNNVSIKIREKADDLLLECSWHGETNKRDANGYDDWYRASAESINETNTLLPRLLETGLQVRSPVKNYSINTGLFKTHASRNLADQDFFLIVPEPKYIDSLWKLYFYFDPRVGLKRCRTTGIEIHNRLGDPDWKIDNLDFERTLTRPWIHDPEKHNQTTT